MNTIKELFYDIKKGNGVKLVLVLFITILITILNFIVPQIQKVIIDNFIAKDNFLWCYNI